MVEHGAELAAEPEQLAAQGYASSDIGVRMLVDEMSHWAELDENNIVIRVTVGNNEEPDEGYSWLVENLGGTWIKASYNGTIRKNFPGPGFTYSEELDAFIPPRPFPSWVLDLETCIWAPPVEMPTNSVCTWDENQLKWVSIEENPWTQ